MGFKTGQDEKFLKLSDIVKSSSIFYTMAANALYGKSESLRTVRQRDLDTELEQEVLGEYCP